MVMDTLSWIIVISYFSILSICLSLPFILHDYQVKNKWTSDDQHAFAGFLLLGGILSFFVIPICIAGIILMSPGLLFIWVKKQLQNRNTK